MLDISFAITNDVIWGWAWPWRTMIYLKQTKTTLHSFCWKPRNILYDSFFYYGNDKRFVFGIKVNINKIKGIKKYNFDIWSQMPSKELISLKLIGSHINADYIYCKREDKTGQSMMYTFGAFTTTSEGIKYLDHDDTSYFKNSEQKIRFGIS